MYILLCGILSQIDRIINIGNKFEKEIVPLLMGSFQKKPNIDDSPDTKKIL